MQSRIKIGFFAHGPGSANALYPLINKLKTNNTFEVICFAFHPYVADLWDVPLITDITLKDLKGYKLNLLLYGTGSGNEAELRIPLLAKKINIPSISILDIFWADSTNLKMRFPIPPTYLIVPNEEVKQMVIPLGIMDKANILPLGNPHFDRLSQWKMKDDDTYKDLDVSFFSQCSTTADFSDTHPMCKRALISLSQIQREHPNIIRNVFVTSHPREDRRWIEAFCNEKGFHCRSHHESFDLMLKTDLNIGLSCTLQYESIIINKRTIFFEDEKKLEEELLHLKDSTKKTFSFKFDATEKILAFLFRVMEVDQQSA